MSERRVFAVAVYARRGGPGGEVLMIHHHRQATWLPVGGELEAGETPLQAARRELAEETGMTAEFRPLAGALDGVPPGFLGYEEHATPAKGLHMTFVFVAQAPAGAAVVPNDEFDEFCWADRDALARLDAPPNVRQFGALALAAEVD